ncbi:MAG: hypothetical protein PHO32_02620 [Candidatus Cloacimonetes bacterium]|nr:hypothetical protein [Candidatus Cloacimonadota bacterium]
MIKYVFITLFALLISGYYNYRSTPEIPAQRRWLLFGLRFISFGILLLLLISPILYYTLHKSLAPQILILEDSSVSMGLKHKTSSKSTYLKQQLEQVKARFKEAGYQLVEHKFANGLEGDSGSSLLNKTLKELSETNTLRKVEGVVLASDGWLRDESLASVQQLGCPFYVLADSTSNPSPDLAVTTARSNRYAWRNEPNTLRAEFSSENYNGIAEAKLYIANRLVSKQNIKLESGTPSSIDFTQRFNQTGFYTWKVELSPLQNESRLSNNSFPGAIEVLAEKERIMLISDKPAWDNKFLLDAITSNPRWEVQSYLNRNGSLYIGETVVSKLNSDNLAAMVIVNNGQMRLDNATSTFVLYSYKQGVGLMFQGLPVAELNPILPLQKSNINTTYQGFIVPTSSAANFPMLSTLSASTRDIPPVDYFYVTASPQTDILATINNPQNSPAIAVNISANARSLSFSALNLWRWQMQSGEDGYNKLMSGCLTWLSNKSSGGYSAIYNNSYFQGEQIRLRLRVEDDIRQSKLDINPRIRIMDSKNKEVLADYLTREGDEFSFTANLSLPDNYSFIITDKETGQRTTGKFILSESSLETRDFGYNLPLLSWLAAETYGKLIFESNLASLSPVPAVKEELITRREIALYKKWYVLSLFILAFCVELYLRRRWGLL